MAGPWEAYQEPKPWEQYARADGASPIAAPEPTYMDTVVDRTLSGEGAAQLDRMAAEGRLEDRTAWPAGMTPQDIADAGDSGLLRGFNLYDEARGVGAMLRPDRTYSEGKAIGQAAVDEYRRQNPTRAMLEEAGNMMIAAPGKVAATVLGRVGQAAGVGGVIGGVTGAADGEGFIDRASQGGAGAVTGGVAGGALGAGGELIGRAVGSVWRGIADRTPKRAANDLGISDDAARMLEGTFVADDPAEALANIQRAGQSAMPADAGEATRSLLDSALATPGPAQRVARDAVNGRASQANISLDSVMNKTLGMPQDFGKLGRGIAEETQAARQAAYDAAYAAPVNYASEAGRRVEGVLKRVPPRIMEKAIRSADEAMIADGVGQRQVMAKINRAGQVSFEEMPNVVQLDYIKRALGDLGSEVDAFGKTTADARIPKKLGRALRNAMNDAVPEYKAATALGADKIERQQAVETGFNLFNRKMRKEDISDLVNGASDAEMAALRDGTRSGIEEQLSQVQRTITDADVPAREAQITLKLMSSRAAREKMALVMEPDDAAMLATELDRASMALELKAAIATNSKTAVRQATQDAVKEVTDPGVIGAVTRGQPLNGTQRAVQATMQTRPSDDAARLSGVYEDIARVLVEPRGKEAERVYMLLSDMVADKRLNRRQATIMARSLYQTGNRFVFPASAEVSEQARATLFPR